MAISCSFGPCSNARVLRIQILQKIPKRIRELPKQTEKQATRKQLPAKQKTKVTDKRICYLNFKILYSTAPAGTFTLTVSPAALLRIAAPTGDSFEIFPAKGSASVEPTKV